MSPASKEELEAVTAAVAKAITDSQPPHKTILDAQGHEPEPAPPQEKKPWWKSSVPAWITGSLLGGILGVGIAWGGMQAANAEQGRLIDTASKKAEATAERLHDVEVKAAALTAGNSAEHEALTEKVDEMKKDVAEVKKTVDKTQADMKDLKDTLAKVLAEVKKP